MFVLCMMAAVATQTNWTGGPGVLGPVSDWGVFFYSCTNSITYASTGQISLKATNWNYSNWTVHQIYSGSVKGAHKGLMGADVDGDGDIDLVGYVGSAVDRLYWFENLGSWSYSQHSIARHDDASAWGASSWVYDLDQDGDPDAFLALPGGLWWYENDGSGNFTEHALDNTRGYHGIRVVDADRDGDLDIFAIDNAVTTSLGHVRLFLNDGSENFTSSEVTSFEAWRLDVPDLNNDGYPDLVEGYFASNSSLVVYLNDGAGNFTQVYSTPIEPDGLWCEDINLDGNVDIVAGATTDHYYRVYYNDGTGTSYTVQTMVNANDYIDGAMARDIDLDGLPDVAVSNHLTGWIRQGSPGSFTLYNIYDNPDFSHWIYAQDVDMGCSPDIDLLLTYDGGHVVVENKMLSAFESTGELVSSILDLGPDEMKFQYLAWDACVPSSGALRFYYRWGSDSTEIVNAAWQGPITAGPGEGRDSFALNDPGCHKMFQYKVEFSGGTDIAILREISVIYESCALYSGEKDAAPPKTLSMKQQGDALVIALPSRLKGSSLSFYTPDGRLLSREVISHLDAGEHRVDLPSRPGIYIALLVWNGGRKSLRVLVR